MIIAMVNFIGKFGKVGLGLLLNGLVEVLYVNEQGSRQQHAENDRDGEVAGPNSIFRFRCRHDVHSLKCKIAVLRKPADKTSPT